MRVRLRVNVNVSGRVQRVQIGWVLTFPRRDRLAREAMAVEPVGSVPEESREGRMATAAAWVAKGADCARGEQSSSA